MPVFLRSWTAGHATADVHLADQLISRHPIVVVDEKLQRDIVQSLLGWQVKDEAFIEDGTEGSLLHVGALLEDANSTVEDVDLHVWV